MKELKLQQSAGRSIIKVLKNPEIIIISKDSGKSYSAKIINKQLLDLYGYNIPGRNKNF